MLTEIEEATYDILSIALTDERIQKYEVMEMNVRFKTPLYLDPTQLRPSASLLAAMREGLLTSHSAALTRFSNEREYFENARHPLNHVLHLQCGPRWFAPMNMTEAVYCAEQQRVHAKQGKKELFEYYERLRKAGVMDDCGLREPGVRPADRDSDDLEALLYSAQPVVIPRYQDTKHDTDEVLRSKSLHGAKRAAQPLVAMISLLSEGQMSPKNKRKGINFPDGVFESASTDGAIFGFTAYFLMSFTAPPASAGSAMGSRTSGIDGNDAPLTQPPRLFRVITPAEAATCSLWVLPTRDFPLRRTPSAASPDDMENRVYGRIPLTPASTLEHDDDGDNDDAGNGDHENNTVESSSVHATLSSLTQAALAQVATAGIKHELRAAALAIGLDSGTTEQLSDPLLALEQSQAKAAQLNYVQDFSSFIELESPFIGRTKSFAMDVSRAASNFNANRHATKAPSGTTSFLSESARKRFSRAIMARAKDLTASTVGSSRSLYASQQPNQQAVEDLSHDAALERLAAAAKRVAEENLLEEQAKLANEALRKQIDLQLKARAEARAKRVEGESFVAIANDAESLRRLEEREAELQRRQIEALRESRLNAFDLSPEEEAILLEIEAPRFDESPQDTQERLQATRERILSDAEADEEFRRTISDRPMQDLATIFFETANKIDAVMASGLATEQVLSSVADPVVEMVPPILAEVSMKIMLPAFVGVAKNTMADAANKFYLPPEVSALMPMPIYTQMHERSLVLPYTLKSMTKHSNVTDQSIPVGGQKYPIDWTSKATIASRLLNFLLAEPLRESLDIMHGSLTANMFAHLNRTVTRRAARALSVALTQSLGAQLTRMSLNIFTRTFTVKPAQSLTRILSSTLTNTLALTVTRALTRAPVADIMCELCRKGKDDYDQSEQHVLEYCDACWSAEVAGQNQEYYTAYYANYYNWYYTHHYGGYYAKHFAEGYFSKNRVGGYKP